MFDQLKFLLPIFYFPPLPLKGLFVPLPPVLKLPLLPLLLLPPPIPVLLNLPLNPLLLLFILPPPLQFPLTLLLFPLLLLPHFVLLDLMVLADQSLQLFVSGLPLASLFLHFHILLSQFLFVCFDGLVLQLQTDLFMTELYSCDNLLQNYCCLSTCDSVLNRHTQYQLLCGQRQLLCVSLFLR